MDLIFLVGNIALICTIASSFSGLPICVDFFKKRSTSNVSVLPFLAGAFCTSLWLQYSIIMEDQTLQTVNTIAFLMQMSYVICFYINTAHKKNTRHMSFGIIAVLLTMHVYGFHMIDKLTAKSIFGFSACIGSILQSAAPLATVKEVYKTKSSESLPVTMIFSTFVVMSLWYIYGVLVADTFIQIPNFIGAILSAIQLCLTAIYPRKNVNVKKD